MTQRYIKRYPLSLLTTAAIIYLSLGNTPDTGGIEIPHLDKAVHFIMYLGLCSVLWFEYLRSHSELDNTRIAIGAIVTPTILGGALEIMQALLTDNRSASVIDFFAGALGVFVAAFVGLYIIRPRLL